MEILGVVKDVIAVPPARTPPPDAAAYQSIVSPAFMVADNITVPVPQRWSSTGLFGAAGAVLTVAVTAVLAADIQPLAVVLVSA